MKEPAAPIVDFQAIAETDSLRRGEDLTVFFTIMNKSNVRLDDVRVTLVNPSALVPKTIAPSNQGLSLSPRRADVPPFGSQRSSTVLNVATNAEFGQHRFIFALDYVWTFKNQTMSSAQTATLSLPITRQFEEEAKGLPGGTAPLLYLLIPIIPAILAFEFWNSLRTGGGIKMPQFKTEYIVPAFLLAVLLSLASLFAAHRNATVDYSSPTGFVIVILSSAALGSLIVLVRFVADLVRLWRRGFDPLDEPEEYLRKALLLYQDGKAPWATGTMQGQEWQGVLLSQPDNTTKALGARMQISVKPGSVLSWEELTATVTMEGKIIDGVQLRQWLSQKKLAVTYLEKIRRAGKVIEGPVATKGLKNFTPAGTTTEKPLAVAVK